MTPAQRRYVTTETLISVVINGMISLAFAWLAFGGSSMVTARALLIDAVPQNAMVALMSVLVPGFLTARRLAAGSVAPLVGQTPGWPLIARAVATAIAAVFLGVLLHAIAFLIWSPPMIPLSTVMVAKTVYGALLAAVVTPIMLRYALAPRAG